MKNICEKILHSLEFPVEVYYLGRTITEKKHESERYYLNFIRMFHSRLTINRRVRSDMVESVYGID